MLPPVDAHLIGRVGVAFQARRAAVEQHATEGSARAIQARRGTQVDPTQGLRTRIARLADQHAATLHLHPHFHKKVRRTSQAAQQQAQQRGHKAFRHWVILVLVL
ncbi:hypothetical protein D3C76_1294150 [compost metagenome]